MNIIKNNGPMESFGDNNDEKMDEINAGVDILED